MKNLIIKLRYKNLLLVHQNQDRLLHQVTKLIITRVILTNKRMRTHFIVQKPHKSGNTTIQTKKVTMVHLQIFPNILSRDKSKNRNLSNKKSGSNIFLIIRPNYNGTSKNFNETAAKPCPPPSQMLLNELKRAK